MYVHAKSLWSCLTLSNPMDCSPPSSSVHGILQARRMSMAWVAMPSCRGSSRPRDQTRVSCIAGRFFTVWTTWEALCWPWANNAALHILWGWPIIPFPRLFQGDLPNPGIEPRSLKFPRLAGGFFTTSATWIVWTLVNNNVSILTHELWEMYHTHSCKIIIDENWMWGIWELCILFTDFL